MGRLRARRGQREGLCNEQVTTVDQGCTKADTEACEAATQSEGAGEKASGFPLGHETVLIEQSLFSKPQKNVLWCITR